MLSNFVNIYHKVCKNIKNAVEYIWNLTSYSRIKKSERYKKSTLKKFLITSTRVLNAPHILNGTYMWVTENNLYIDIVFPNVPLAVIVTELYYGNYSSKAPTRKLWEEYMKEVNRVVLACDDAKMPLLIITPDTPLDEYSIERILRDIK